MASIGHFSIRKNTGASGEDTAASTFAGVAPSEGKLDLRATNLGPYCTAGFLRFAAYALNVLLATRANAIAIAKDEPGLT